MKDRKIKKNLDDALCDVIVSEHQHNRILDEVTGGKKMKKKITLSFAFAMLMVFTVVTALALTVSAFVRTNMTEVVVLHEQGVFERWELDDKVKFIRLMEKFGIEMDDQRLADLHASKGSAEELDMMANLLIDQAYGQQMKSGLPDYVDQPEKYPSPDFYTIFSELWKRESSNATTDEIKEGYEQWLIEEQIFQSVKAEDDVGDKTELSETEIKELFSYYLSEVLSLSKEERKHFEIVTEYLPELRVWKASYRIGEEHLKTQSSEYLRKVAQYNDESKVFEQNVLYSAIGELLDYTSKEELEYDQLIPRSAYPGIDDARGTYHAFFTATVEEKADFSKKWKSVVDAWLEEHPEFAKRFERELWADSAYVSTRHTYGTPSDASLSQEGAYEIAKKTYLDAGIEDVSSDMINQRCVIGIFYDITNSEKPLWKISFDSTFSNVNENKAGYHVVIDAFSGEVINSYPLTGYPINNTVEYVDRYL